MLGCTKYKCKEVTVFFIYLLLPASMKRKKYNLLLGLVLTEIARKK